MSITANELTAAVLIGWVVIFMGFFGVMLTDFASKIPLKGYYMVIGVSMVVWMGGGYISYNKIIDGNAEWFKSGGDLICDGDNKMIVSRKQGYEYRGGYFIKENVIVNDFVCAALQ